MFSGLGLSESERIISRLRDALDNAPTHVYIKDINCHYIYANQLTLSLFHCDEETMLGKTDYDFFPDATAELIQLADRAVLGGEKLQRQFCTVDRHGREYVFIESKSPLYSDEDKEEVIGLLGITSDITHQKKLEEELKRAAFTDELTGLLNRRALLEHLEQSIKRCQRDKTYSAVYYIDLDKFKSLNDLFGHQAGDNYLKEIAKRLKSSLRAVDVVARIGGDEFVVLTEDLSHSFEQARQYAEQVACKLTEELKKHWSDSGVDYQGSASVGLCLFNDDANTASKLLSKADQKMYQIKNP